MEYYRIADLVNAGLSIMTRPDAEKLVVWAERLKIKGIAVVISLLEDVEIEEYGLGPEERILREQGISFQRFPIADNGVPTLSDLQRVVALIGRHLRNGDEVAVHCLAGIGRSGLLAACVLLAHGFDSFAAVEKVSRARGELIPASEEQCDFLFDLSFAQGNFSLRRCAGKWSS